MKPIAVSSCAVASKFAVLHLETIKRASKFPYRANGNNTLATDRFVQSMSSTMDLRPATLAAWANSDRQGIKA